MENNLYVSPSPHIHGGDSISKNMYGVLIALIPAFLVSLYFFGLGALIVTVVSVLACMIFEYLIQRFLMKKEPTLCDGSAILTGVLLAFNLPSNLPVWIIIIGALAADRHRQDVFRWLGNNIFNPALVGPCILIDLLPGTDDDLAGGRCLERFPDDLYGRPDRRDGTVVDERGRDRASVLREYACRGYGR